jgi:hypothetical protein
MNAIQTQNHVDRDIIRSIPEPFFTRSWHPISHKRCDDIYDVALRKRNIKVFERIYSTSKDGDEVYAKLIIGDQKQEITSTLIWRNAINKMFSFGTCGGTHAWACSNLMMFGEFVEFRRHTKGVDDDELLSVVTRGLDKILPTLNDMVGWQEALRSKRITVNECEAAGYEVLREGIISKQRFAQFDNLLFGEDHSYEPTTVFGFHGACTETMRDLNMSNNLVIRQRNLKQLIQRRWEI